MPSSHLVDPEILPALDLFPPFTKIDATTLAELRARVEDGVKLQQEIVDTSGVSIEQIHVPADGERPAVRVLIYRPEAKADAPTPALLHFHGGGMLMGKPEIRHGWMTALARDLGCLIASVDYRKAPENPFPAAVEDGHAALVWLAANAAQLGIDPARIAIGGESAGGGVAAQVTLLNRERNGPPLVAQMLTYPMLDDRTMPGTRSSMQGQYIWSAEANRFGWSSLLGDAHQGDVPTHAVPARAVSLAGLPPAFVGVGALDLFLDEDLEYARRLAGEGVPVELHVYPGAFHAFDAMVTAQIAQQFARDWRAAIGRFWDVASQ